MGSMFKLDQDFLVLRKFRVPGFAFQSNTKQETRNKKQETRNKEPGTRNTLSVTQYPKHSAGGGDRMA